jgi:16S rRNA (cytosine967-C5)-methyltransferase
VISPARRVAYELLCDIEFRGVFSDYAVNSARVARLDVRDRHLVMELVYGCLRWQMLLDQMLAGFSARPWEKIDPNARILLRMALYQMWRMDRVPNHAAVNDAVELAKQNLRRGAEGFINGLLRQAGRDCSWKEEDFRRRFEPWVRASLPKWLWRRWETRWGAEAALNYALSLNRPPARAFRLVAPEAAPSGWEPSSLVPGAFIETYAARGSETVEISTYQDEASQLIPHLFGEISGMQIWDACAAPGGKSAILAERAGNSGRVVSSDLHPNRAGRLGAFLRDLGRTRADVVVVDARRPPPFQVTFDAVLADVPCSGLGTLRRNPEIKWRITREDVVRLNRVQLELLASVSHSVRPGGLLLYSTCSTEPEENEEVVEEFLKKNSQFSLRMPQNPPGIADWLDSRGMLRTFPADRIWDGFFAALMARSA